MISKNEARRISQRYRSSLSKQEYKNLSLLITHRLSYLHAFKRAVHCHFFVGATSKREIDTKPLIEILLNSGRIVYVPKSEKKAHTMSSHRIYSLDDLKSGLFKIEEPTTPATNRKAFDVIIVPLLACDFYGNRVGFGGGFYDRFLKDTEGVKVGIVYDACVFDAVDSEPFDVPLDFIVTEKREIEIKKDIL